ncbi:MAG: hypothetical protein U0132_18325 [Gemmatimonadaceae bacterium]
MHNAFALCRRVRGAAVVALVAGGLGLVAACGGDGVSGPTIGGPAAPNGLASCAPTPVLTVSPIELSQIYEFTPLGNLNPSGHVFPTDHMYFYTRAAAGGLREEVPLRFPGNGRVGNVMVQKFLAPTPHFDYTVSFFPCADLRIYFAHVTELLPSFAAKVGSMDVSCNAPYTTGGITVQQCYKDVSIEVAAGDTFALTRGGDFGAYDRRTPALGFINQVRIGGSGDFGQLHTVCPVDYFEPGVRDGLRALLGRFGQSVHRTIEPVCGEIMQDKPNTAQGRWFYDNSPTEDAHLALVHDNVDPTQAVFSVGTSVPGLTSGTYAFAPNMSAADHVNVDFGQVTADGAIFCYETQFPRIRRVLVQLLTGSRLRIEASSATTCGPMSTWVFTPSAAEFSR